MRIKGWVTFSIFAFASSLISNVVDVILGNSDHVMASVLRRLYFVGYTLTATDLRSKVERSWDEPPKRRPAPEWHSQLETMKAKLTDVDLRGPNVIDLCAAMVKEGVLRYIQWEDLPSRADELTGGNKIKEWKPIASRTLKEVSSEELKNTDLKIYQAFNRQGVALEMSHDRLTKLFIEEYQREPPDGYSKVRADQEALRILGDETREGLSANGMGVRPLDKPLVHRSKAKGDGKSQKGEKEKEKEKKKKGKGSKGAGIGGKNMKRGQGAMPGGLEGSSVTKNGKRIGFGYNVGACAEKAAGCPGGRHVCTKCRPYPWHLIPSRR
jgi:hypothetical protein